MERDSDEVRDHDDNNAAPERARSDARTIRSLADVIDLRIDPNGDIVASERAAFSASTRGCTPNGAAKSSREKCSAPPPKPRRALDVARAFRHYAFVLPLRLPTHRA